MKRAAKVIISPLHKIVLCVVVFAFGGQVFAQADCAAPPAPNVDWSGCTIDNQTFNNVDLSGANLSGATLNKSVFENSNLTNVNFAEAELAFVTFPGSNLTGANFANAEFEAVDGFGTSFIGANITNANFQGVSTESIRSLFYDATTHGITLTTPKGTLIWNTDSPTSTSATVNYPQPTATLGLNGAIDSGFIIANLEPGDVFPLGETTVNVSLTDIEDDSYARTASFVVSVVPPEPPTVGGEILSETNAAVGFVPEGGTAVILVYVTNPNQTLTLTGGEFMISPGLGFPNSTTPLNFQIEGSCSGTITPDVTTTPISYQVTNFEIAPQGACTLSSTVRGAQLPELMVTVGSVVQFDQLAGQGTVLTTPVSKAAALAITSSVTSVDVGETVQLNFEISNLDPNFQLTSGLLSMERTMFLNVVTPGGIVNECAGSVEEPPNEGFQLNFEEITVDPGQSCTISVMMQPSPEGPDMAVVDTISASISGSTVFDLVDVTGPNITINYP